MENMNLPVGMYEQKNYIDELTEKKVTQYVSFDPKTKEEKKILFKAMNNPEKHLKDCINMKVKIQNVYCEVVEMTDDETGHVQVAPRIVLIDDKGVGYQCVSLGVYGAVKKLFQIMGTPDTWEEPVEVMVKQVNRGVDKNILTFELV